MLRFKSIRKIAQATVNLFLIGVALAFSLNANATSIGEITEFKGESKLVREAGNEVGVEIGFVPDVNLNDTAETGNGRMLIQFLDEAELSLTEHTKVYIDKVYYDPDPSKSKMAIRMAVGTARFASGRLGMVNKSNIDIQTPTASIAVRGTDFTTTIDELGRSLVILLPDEYGNSSGEITVSNNGGSIVLNEAYAATMISSLDTQPTKQLSLRGITVSMIDNMFIVSPPPEVREALDERLQDDLDQDKGLLDIDFLDFDGLDVDYLEDDSLEFTELDIDYLNVDFLTDVLDVVEALVASAAKLDDSAIQQTSLGAELKGATFGLNPKSQYNIYELDGKVVFYRSVNETITIYLNVDARASIRTSVDGYEGIILLNGGDDTIIDLRQGG
jgi:hypothetical protein|tara:strand:- start:81 stop:1244 length:1164 start_codon:yes stop_codon:yes gene_type:complete